MLKPLPQSDPHPRPFAVTDDVRHVAEAISGNLDISFRMEGEELIHTVGRPVHLIEFIGVDGGEDGEYVSHIPTWVPLQWESDRSHGIDLVAELRSVARSSMTGEFIAQYVVTIVGDRTDHRGAGRPDHFPPCDMERGMAIPDGEKSRSCPWCGRTMVPESVPTGLPWKPRIDIWVCPSGRRQRKPASPSVPTPATSPAPTPATPT